METEITCDWIDRYNDGELDQYEKEIFQKRILVNPLLRSEVNIDASLNRFLMDAEALDLMKKLKAAPRRRTQDAKRLKAMLLAASVLCLVMIGGIFYLVRPTAETTGISKVQETNKIRPEKTGASAKVHEHPHFLNTDYNTFISGHLAENQGFLAKNFESLEEFELLTGSVTRSDQVKIVSPAANLTVMAATDVLFAWQSFAGNDQLTLIILDNRGVPVSEISLHDVNSYILKTGTFTEGLYYWKIVVDEDLVLMGKLVIL